MIEIIHFRADAASERLVDQIVHSQPKQNPDQNANHQQRQSATSADGIVMTSLLALGR